MWFTKQVIITLKLIESNAPEETRQKLASYHGELNFY